MAPHSLRPYAVLPETSICVGFAHLTLVLIIFGLASIKLLLFWGAGVFYEVCFKFQFGAALCCFFQVVGY